MGNNHPLDSTEDALRDADAAGRVRARMLLALGAFVLLWVFANGLALWDQLPDPMPTHFGRGGAVDAWGPKNVFSVFGLLILAAVMLVGIALLRQRPHWYNFPGKEKARLLPPDQQSHVYAPLQEAMAWLATCLAAGLSLLCQQMWFVSLHQRRAISPALALAPAFIGLAAIIVGTVVATRRLRRPS